MMKAAFLRFGEIEVDGQRFDRDVVITGGSISKRDKKPSKAFRGRYGHTPLSAHEAIPWECETLIIGTGVYGSLPIMDEVYKLAEKNGVKVIAVPTTEACRLLSEADMHTTNAILHVTC